MSSTVRSTTPSPQAMNGQGGSRIVHFDATERRREKMRRAAGQSEAPAAAPRPAPPRPAAAAAPAAPSRPAPAPAAARPQPAAPRPQPAATVPFNGAAAPTPAKSNGAVAHRAPAAPAAPTAAPAVAVATGPRMDPKQLEQFLINFVVEQTGYPAEMVELDADLEADLGIDSIKKAQLFGELGEHFIVQLDESLSLDDFPTLRHVMNFLKDQPTKSAGGAPDANGHAAAPAPAASPAPSQPVAKAAVPFSSPPARPAAPAPASPAPRVAPAPAAAPTAPAAQSGGLSGKALEDFLVNFVVEQTGYPPEMVELDADLEADLGIDSIKKAQLFGELGEHFIVTIDESLSLDDFPTLRHVVRFLDGKPSRSAGAAPAPAPAAAAPVAAPVRPPAAAFTAPAPVAAPVRAVSPMAPSTASPSTKVASAGAATAVATRPPMTEAELEQFLINFVVEQTGYPPEMVELDADLEADLGIDSIKKAQLFGELGEHFVVTVDESLSLDDFPTLRHVMNFLAGVPRR